MAESYDVIIIGGGPAGSTAAKFAAQSGAKTIMLEKHPVIGYPLCCAEAISVMGLTNVVELNPRWVASKIERVKLFSPAGKTAVINHPDAGYVLERKIFDRDLAEQAAIAGADIRVGTDVIKLLQDKTGRIVGVAALNNGQQIEILGKVIIAADGVESQIAAQAGFPTVLKPKQIHSAYQYLLADVDIEPETLEFYFGNQTVPGGYIWVFCKGDSTANVGLGICPSKSPDKKAVDYLDEFIEKRFDKPKIIERMTGGVPTYLPDLPLYKDNVMLAGDAARLIDSLSGAGIANALLSGKIAGQTAGEMINNGSSAEAYPKKFNSIKQRELKFYYYCQEIFLKLTDDDLDIVVKFIGDIFRDKTITAFNPLSVIKKLILSSPRLIKLGRHLLKW